MAKKTGGTPTRRKTESVRGYCRTSSRGKPHAVKKYKRRPSK